MICPQCRKEFSAGASACPHCGRRNDSSGVFQTSTVLISAEGADRVYRSVDEVPAPLRHRLIKTTNGANSATILIADRNGRKEIDKAMRKLPASAQRRFRYLAPGAAPSAEPPGRLTPRVCRWIAAAFALLALCAAVAVILYRAK